MLRAHNVVTKVGCRKSLLGATENWGWAQDAAGTRADWRPLFGDHSSPNPMTLLSLMLTARSSPSVSAEAGEGDVLRAGAQLGMAA